MIVRMAVYARRFKRWFNRSFWAIRLLGLSKSEGTSSTPGLVMVQIDGLSQKQLSRALKEGNMPFLKRLLEREKYVEYAHYSGLPSATPAVQGELFYGVKGCVPAFNFIDHEAKQPFILYEPKSASEIETRIAKGNIALLEGGSSYGNIFGGGAAESHFCVSTVGWKGLFKALNPFAWPLIFLFHLNIFLKTFALLVVETVLAFYDCFIGVFKGEKIFYELQFVLTRVFLCILMRELVILGAKIDIARGLPIIHLNFLGYDEQSHRRGPSSDFAHWSLRGIDDGIKRLWREAQRADRRDYDFWVYSDHGQEFTKPYPIEHNRRMEDVVAEIFGDVAQGPRKVRHKYRNCCQGRFSFFAPSSKEFDQVEKTTSRVKVAGMGPLAHVYSLIELNETEKKRIVTELLQTAKVPLVLMRGKPGEVLAKTPDATFTLPQAAVEVFGVDHPFLNEIAMDLVDLCHHPSSGDFIVAGWRAGQKPTTFPIENGSHAGFGMEETNGFALLPADAPLPIRTRSYIRPLDLREAALRVLERLPQDVAFEWQPPAVAKTFRVMTYNVHGCVGMDGKLSPSRIARVIARHDLDAVALQELDVNRMRSGGVDQVELIARKLQMSYHFHPTYHLEDGKYGNAILSRYPMQVVRMGPLPKYYPKREFEPRGALWVEIDVGGTKVHLFNCHLSLWPPERLKQAEAIVGSEWIGSQQCKEPVILCGDFNATPRSSVCQRIGCKLRDAQSVLKSHKPHSTWLSSYPLSRIDHIFVSPQVDVVGITVPRTELDKVASDHVPLIAELQIMSSNVQGSERNLKDEKPGFSEEGKGNQGMNLFLVNPINFNQGGLQ